MQLELKDNFANIVVPYTLRQINASDELNILFTNASFN